MPEPERRPRTLARRLLRYSGWAALGLVLLLTGAVGAVAVLGGARLNGPYAAPTHPVALPTDPADVAEGGRLAAFWGCVGCHRPDAGGGVFFESPAGDRIVAPNLTRIVREYDLEALERAIRHGVRPDGASLVIMPSSMYAAMSDEDLGKVLAYLRSLPSVPDTLPSRRMGLLARTMVLLDQSGLEARRIPSDAEHGISPDSLHPSSPRADTLAMGRYLAHTGCPECHGADLRGHGDDTPDLRIAAAYSPDRFLRFTRDGIALDGQEKELMTEIARGRLSRLTPSEVAALHTYLRTLAD